MVVTLTWYRSTMCTQLIVDLWLKQKKSATLDDEPDGNDEGDGLLILVITG
jgi:hypothetical protein